MDFYYQAFDAVLFVYLFQRVLDFLDAGILEFATETLLDRALVYHARFQFTHHVDTPAAVIAAGRPYATERFRFVIEFVI